MGHLFYTPQQAFQFDDYLLTHLRTVIITKLIQQESFIFTWVDEGHQRSIWLHPAMPISFEFTNSDVPPMNREWVNELLTLANGPGGLRVTEEPPTKPS